MFNYGTFTKARAAQFARLLLLRERHKFFDEPTVHSLHKRTAARQGKDIVGDSVALGHGSSRFAIADKSRNRRWSICEHPARFRVYLRDPFLLKLVGFYACIA